MGIPGGREGSNKNLLWGAMDIFWNHIFVSFDHPLEIKIFLITGSMLVLTFTVEPTVSVKPCPSSYTEGSNVTLYCNATGNPLPNVAWINQGTGEILTSNEQLILTAVNRSQAGPYQCHASNGIVRNFTRTCTLDVLCK